MRTSWLGWKYNNYYVEGVFVEFPFKLHDITIVKLVSWNRGSTERDNYKDILCHVELFVYIRHFTL